MDKTGSQTCKRLQRDEEKEEEEKKKRTKPVWFFLIAFVARFYANNSMVLSVGALCFHLGFDFPFIHYREWRRQHKHWAEENPVTDSQRTHCFFESFFRHLLISDKCCKAIITCLMSIFIFFFACSGRMIFKRMRIQRRTHPFVGGEGGGGCRQRSKYSDFNRFWMCLFRKLVDWYPG